MSVIIETSHSAIRPYTLLAETGSALYALTADHSSALVVKAPELAPIGELGGSEGGCGRSEGEHAPRSLQ